MALDVDTTAQIAWLQDILNLTKTTIVDLFRAGFTKYVVDSFLLLSRKPEFEIYKEYIALIAQSGNFSAIIISLCKLDDSIDPDVAKQEGHEALVERYAVSCARLRMAAASLGYTGP